MENGEELLSTLDSDEELDKVYDLFMEQILADEDEWSFDGIFRPADGETPPAAPENGWIFRQGEARRCSENGGWQNRRRPVR